MLTSRSSEKSRYSQPILVPEMLKSPPLVTYGACKAVSDFVYFIEKLTQGQLLQSIDGQKQSILWAQGRELDCDLRAWETRYQASDLHGRWQEHTIISNKTPAVCGRVLTYNSTEAAKAWNQHRCVRLRLCQALLDLAFYDPSHLTPKSVEPDCPSDIVRDTRNVIDEMLDGICSSIPFCMYRIDSQGKACSDPLQCVSSGAGLVWPLEVVLSCPYSSETHRAMAIGTLKEIAYHIGVRQALIPLRTYMGWNLMNLQ